MMAKEIAISKELKISKAQEYVLLAVFGASCILGVAIAFVVYFFGLFNFNVQMLTEQSKAITSYSTTLENIGICVAPKGDTYTDEELKKCNPNTTNIDSVSNSLRYAIYNDLAANQNLSSIQRSSASDDCVNPATGKNWTYDELNQIYDEADNEDTLSTVNALMKTCSALRVIPDALPAYKNESAFLASLNKIFNVSNWTPEKITSIKQDDDTTGTENSVLGVMTFSFEIKGSMQNTITVLKNTERSIREISIRNVTFKWDSDSSLSTTVNTAEAYYVNSESIGEDYKTVGTGASK